MESLVGIFNSRQAAEKAVAGLHSIGRPADSVVFLMPGENTQNLTSVPTTDAESPGMGEMLMGYVGGVVGGGIGLGAGAAIASVLVPGVGAVLAVGIGAAALLGVGGAAVGAALGDESEKTLDQGVPRDDVLFYRKLLKHGKSLVIASAEIGEDAAAVHSVFRNYGGEDVDAARAEWRAGNFDQAA